MRETRPAGGRLVAEIRREEERTKPCIFCAPAAKYQGDAAARLTAARRDGPTLRREREDCLDRSASPLPAPLKARARAHTHTGKCVSVSE